MARFKAAISSYCRTQPCSACLIGCLICHILSYSDIFCLLVQSSLWPSVPSLSLGGGFAAFSSIFYKHVFPVSFPSFSLLIPYWFITFYSTLFHGSFHLITSYYILFHLVHNSSHLSRSTGMAGAPGAPRGAQPKFGSSSASNAPTLC